MGYYSSGKWTAAEGVDHSSYVSCPDKNFCISVDRPAQAWTYQGGTWSGPVVTGSNAVVPVGVFCAARNFCIAVDGDSLAVSYS